MCSPKGVAGDAPLTTEPLLWFLNEAAAARKKADAFHGQPHLAMTPDALAQSVWTSAQC